MKLTAFCLCWFSFLVAKADTFIVTTNADSGPGTLREAIILANGNGTLSPDTIIYAISDITRSGRTIALLTQLPDLTSNIIIDGTTQPGDKIGKSDAKIILYVYTLAVPQFSFLKISNANNIQVYGMFMLNGYFSAFLPTATVVDGIEFLNSQNLIIGKPGKGNYFRGLKHAIFTTNNLVTASNSSDITIQANIFGNNEDGEPNFNSGSGYINSIEYAFRLFNCKNITVGGSAFGEENTITASEAQIQSYFPSGNGFIKLIRNNWGVRTNGTLPSAGSSSNVKISIVGGYLGTYSSIADYDLQIKNNFISGRIHIHGLTKKFLIQGNHIIYDNHFKGGFHPPKITVTNCINGGVIGGETEDLINEFENLRCEEMKAITYESLPQGSVVASAAPKLLILKNKMKINHQYGSSIRVENIASIRIDSMAKNFVRGKAAPNSKIDIYLDDECQACDGEVYLGNTQSAADSTWSFSGIFNTTVIATATKDSTTSNYTEPFVNTQSYSIKHPTCGQSNGYIKGLKGLGSWTSTEWHQYYLDNGVAKDSLVTKESDLINVPPGNYYIIARLGPTCQSAAIHFRLRNYSPKIDTATTKITQPSCGLNNGSIYSLRLIDAEFSKIRWTNENGVEFMGSPIGGLVSINNLPAGNYKLIVIDTTSGCADSTNVFTLTNQKGPSLNTSNIRITDATCGGANGKITGVTAIQNSGFAYKVWVDSVNKVVGSDFELLNVPAGKYRLKFKDASSCDTVITPFYTIQDAGKIVMDTSGLKKTASHCAAPTGTITGINITGATNYKWVDSAGNTISNQLNPGNLIPGKYVLIASNQYCEKSTYPIVIAIIPQASFSPALLGVVKPATCDSANGYARLLNFPDPIGYAFRWIDAGTNNIVGNNMDLDNIKGGNYTLYAMNAKGCEQIVHTAQLNTIPPIKLNASAIKITDDACNQGVGSIEGAVVINGSGTAPFTYAWYDVQKKVLSNKESITNQKSGVFRLMATDEWGCKDSTQFFTIQNKNTLYQKPKYKDQTIVKNTATTLTDLNLQSGTYLLFDASLSLPIAQNTSGTFITDTLTSDKIFYIKIKNGDCESELSAVYIKIVDETKVFVPSGFTPNKDGKNESLKPLVIGAFLLEYFTVYDRWGGIVFQSTDINKGWEGKVKGKDATPGVYVWLLKGKDIKGNELLMKGSSVLIR